MTRPVAPTREDPVARVASEVAGGPAGRHLAAGRGRWPATSVLALLTVPTLVLAVLLRQPCRALRFASPDQLTHACYSDVPAVVSAAGLDRGVLPYLSTPDPSSADGTRLTEPIGTGWLLAALAALAPDGADAVVWVFDLAVVLVAVALVVTVLAVAALAGRRPWDAALVAVSPVVPAAALVSLDLVAVALAVLGVLAQARSRPGVAGVLLGLAVVVRPTALLVLLAVLVLAVRAGRRRTAGTLAGAALAGWGAVSLPVLAVSPAAFTASWQGTLSLDAGYGSLWLLPQLAGAPLPAGVVRWLALSAVIAVVVGVLAWALTLAHRPRLPALVVVLVAGVLVVSPAVPVQTSLWLLPFAALAVPVWRDHLLWGAAELAYATGTWLYLYGLQEPDRGLPPWAYGTLLVLRLAAIGWLAARAVALSRSPERDPVRAPADAPGLGRDDPAAGPLEGATDAVVVRFR
ncbi:DUF2029 domain-containing protein [Kineosporiaceae bacterium SCSIO 59966]|nr:DUF2029 domain-containing protein [Kineosporiaceae bacterium SCSIO 59966]